MTAPWNEGKCMGQAEYGKGQNITIVHGSCCGDGSPAIERLADRREEWLAERHRPEMGLSLGLEREA